MKGKKRKDEWEDEWEDDWEDDWEGDASPKSPVQRFVDWTGLPSLLSSKKAASDDDLDEDDDPDAAPSSPVQHFVNWSRDYWQRMLSLIFFALGLVLILRLAVLSIGT